jgi:preprotein translocase SecE subunit
MDKQLVKKITTLSFLVAGVLVWVAVGVVFRALAGAFGAVQRLYGMDVVSHGLPLFAGVVTFFVLQFNPRILEWAETVIQEVAKVVWPSRKDTVGMTIVTVVMVLIASGVLFVFDNIARLVIGVVLG